MKVLLILAALWILAGVALWLILWRDTVWYRKHPGAINANSLLRKDE